MTKKEKAQEIFDKYYDILFTSDFRDIEAKKCSVEAVNQIISACEYNNVESYNTEWWNEVITELKLL